MLGTAASYTRAAINSELASATVALMNTLADTQQRVLWGIPVWLTLPTLESMKMQGQIVTVEGANYALNRDQGKVTLHRVAIV